MVLSAKTETENQHSLHCCPNWLAASLEYKRGFRVLSLEGCASYHLSGRVTCDQRAASWGPVSSCCQRNHCLQSSSNGIHPGKCQRQGRLAELLSACGTASGYYSQEGNSTHHLRQRDSKSQLTRVKFVAACFLGISWQQHTHACAHPQVCSKIISLQLTMANIFSCPMKCRWRRFLDQETQ